MNFTDAFKNKSNSGFNWLRLNFFFSVLLLTMSLFFSFPKAIGLGVHKKLAEKMRFDQLDITNDFINYFDTLLKNQVIDDKDLIEFHNSLSQGVINNPVNEDKILKEANLLIHFEGFNQFLQNTKYYLDGKKLLEWSLSVLRERKNIRNDQSCVKTEVHFPYQKMVFYPIPPGEYLWNQGKPIWHETLFRVQRIVKIAEPFEMMSTLVTQWHWVMVMGENPAQEVEKGVFMSTLDKTLEGNADHPIEMISYIDIVEKFLPKLNKMSAEGDPSLKYLVLDYQKGDQFRLPGDDEWEYVASNLGQTPKDQLCWFGNNKTELMSCSWTPANSNGKSHEVAQLRPLLVNGFPFYDLLGNVSEWTKDFFYNYDQDPAYNWRHLNKKNEEAHIAIRSGHFLLDWELGHTYRHYEIASRRSSITGFRLVRIRKQP